MGTPDHWAGRFAVGTPYFVGGVFLILKMPGPEVRGTWALVLDCVDEPSGELGVEDVAAAGGGDVGVDGPADEGEVADEVEDLVACWFVGEAHGRGGGGVGAEDEDFVGVDVGEEPGGTESLGLLRGAEGACRGDLLGITQAPVCVRLLVVGPLDGKACGLGWDRGVRAVVEVVLDL